MRNESIFNYTLALGKRFVCLLLCACSVPASGNAVDDLQLRVRMTIGEDSKASSMQTTTISIEPHSNTIVWRRIVDGGERMFIKIFPSHEEYKLSPANRRKLITLIESGHLLTNDSIKLRPDIDYPRTLQYFDISFTSTLNGKSGSFIISGPRNAVQVKDEKLYQNLIALVKEIYRIIKSQGGSVVFEELLTSKKTRPAVTQSPAVSNDIQ